MSQRNLQAIIENLPTEKIPGKENQASINRSPKLRQTVGDKLHPGASGKFWSLGIRTCE